MNRETKGENHEIKTDPIPSLNLHLTDRSFISWVGLRLDGSGFVSSLASLLSTLVPRPSRRSRE